MTELRKAFPVLTMPEGLIRQFAAPHTVHKNAYSR